ncbi:hypothetical protein OROMI_007313 [Orobanche minor]
MLVLSNNLINLIYISKSSSTCVHTLKNNHQSPYHDKTAKRPELKNAVRDYEVADAYEIMITRNIPELVLAVSSEGCSWRLYASWTSSKKSFQIKTLWSEHKCTRKTSLKIVTQSWLAVKYGEKIRKNPTWKTKELKDDVLERYGLHVSYIQCLRAKKKALGEEENGSKDHYAILRRYGKDVSICLGCCESGVHGFLALVS